MTPPYTLVGIGNAIVDAQTSCDDGFLSDNAIEKGIMTLVDQERGEALYHAMQDPQQSAGGSVANTIAGAGALGAKSAFIGRVKDDALGQFYDKELRSHNIAFPNRPVQGDDMSTSRSMIFVSPDGERSMNTFLGISAELSPADIPQVVLGNGEILFIEGYLYDKPAGKAAIHEAATRCRAGRGMAGVSLSDPFCVERHRDDFKKLVTELDYVIGNHHEWMSLYQTQTLDEALAMASQDCDHIVATHSDQPVQIIHNGAHVSVPVTATTPVDATGAGDQFAAGYLYGLSIGAKTETRGKMGIIAAREVISHFGARPDRDVSKLFAVAGLT